MKDPKHVPSFLMLGAALRANSIPFLPFVNLVPDTSCTADPSQTFLFHQHVYGPFPANDDQRPGLSRA